MSPVWAAGVQAQGGEPQAARAPHGCRAVPCKGQERLTGRNPSSSDRLLFRCRLQEACLLKLSCGAPAAACHGGGAGFCWLDCGLAASASSRLYCTSMRSSALPQPLASPLAILDCYLVLGSAPLLCYHCNAVVQRRSGDVCVSRLNGEEVKQFISIR